MNHTEGQVIIAEIFKGLKNAVIGEYESDFALKKDDAKFKNFKDFLEQEKTNNTGVDGKNIDKNIDKLSYIIMGLLKFNTAKDKDKIIKYIIKDLKQPPIQV